MARLTFLGTGTSDGIPQLGCRCAVCRSTDRRDRRLRSAVLVGHGPQRLVVDTGMDFRRQALRCGLSRLDAVCLTHAHLDHCGGLMELRPFCKDRPAPIPCYGNHETISEIRRRFDYIFQPVQEGGGLPALDLVALDGSPFPFADRMIVPLPARHGQLVIFGYRFGELAYLTDVSSLPESTWPLLHGCRTLVLNALRQAPHPTHLSLDEAVAVAERVGAQSTYLTHLAHDLCHRELEERLPKGIRPAHDGLQLSFTF